MNIFQNILPYGVFGKSRAINAENPTGEKGKGGMASSNLGKGRKGSPCPFATSVPSAFAFFISSVSSGIGIGVSWMLNFSRSSPSLHMVDQNSYGLVEI